MICSAPVYADVVSNAQNQCDGDLWVVEISITPVVDYRALIAKYACTKGGFLKTASFMKAVNRLNLLNMVMSTIHMLAE